jgi:hypothetical protein
VLKETCTRIFIAELFVIEKFEQPESPPVGQRINSSIAIQQNTSLKKNESELYA